MQNVCSTINTLLSCEVTNLVVGYAFSYDHPIWHHQGCNVRKFKNDKQKCNCLFSKTHVSHCIFIRYNSVERKRSYAATSGSFVHYWASTRINMCNCAVLTKKPIPKKK